MNREFEEIIAIKGWNKPQNDGKIDPYPIMENIEARLSRRLPLGTTLSLTNFQKKVIHDPIFWRDWKDEGDCGHLMVQGATSAGKTLVSELNIIDTLFYGKKAIVLVPLKAMVHERTEHFHQDMPELRVFGASSDHMENDERIINGDYDVAVIVYEKFFSMLSQNSGKIMEACGLLIVDELSMLSKEQRGPKLEMVLEIVKMKYQDTRIMCLATCDCSTEKICRWLNITEPIISTARPVPLEEHILLPDGTGIYRKIPKNHEVGDDNPEKLDEKLDVPGYRIDWRPGQKRKELLRVVLRKICTDVPNARILIFVGSQSATADIARYLKESVSELFPPIQKSVESTEFMKKVNACDRDDAQDELITDLLPRGIAYHHAGISTTLREVIEEEFQRQDSFIKVIVATETLTIGVNMPFDAMIMVTNMVPRGLSTTVPLTHQEYRNYIGRAGRLGQNKRTGITYLFVEDRKEMTRYWNSYYSREEVTSALTKASEEELAPYYLSLLSITSRNLATFGAEQVDGLFADSLSKTCNPRKSCDSDDLCEHLCDGYLAQEIRTKAKGAKGAKAIRNQKYAVCRFGELIAPYALSKDTCINIYCYFLEGDDYGGLPSGTTQEDIESDRYLLEILYHICRHKEVADSSVLTFPDDAQNSTRSFTAKQKVLKQLKCILSEKDEQGQSRSVLWCEHLSQEDKTENELWMLANKGNLPDERAMLQAAMRAILLYYWTHGKTIAEIRSITGFKDILSKLISGDIERLAEIVSFHLDAIHKSLKAVNGVCADASAFSAFYALQTRVKYGMSRDLVQFANKHIYGLDRSRLLSLKRDADKMSLTPVQYLYMAPVSRRNKHLSPTHQNQLLQALERRSSVREFDTLMEIVSKDAGSKLTAENEAALRTIADWDGADPEELYDSLKGLMRNDAFKLIETYTDGSVHCVFLLMGDRKLCIGIPGKAPTEKTVSRIKTFFRDNYRYSRLLFAPSKNGWDEWDTSDVETAFPIYDCTASMNTTFLAMILAKAIHMDLGGGGELFEFLTDARGIFTKSEFKNCFLSNYLCHSREDEPPKFRLLYSHDACPDIGELKIALSKAEDLQHYEILPWGSKLNAEEYNFCDCPTILVLGRDHITRSESLSRFLCTMLRQNFENCMLLLDSDIAEQNWNTPDSLEEYGCNSWNSKYIRIRKAIVKDGSDAVREIRSLVNVWEHKDYLIGISYAHYDPQYGIPENSDVEHLRCIANGLREIYGEHRIMYDEFEPARFLFPFRGEERSLAAYRKCKVNLILWNYWSANNNNCKKEHTVICEQCEARRAERMYLQSGQPADPDVPKGHFATALDDYDNVIRSVQAYLDTWKD